MHICIYVCVYICIYSYMYIVCMFFSCLVAYVFLYFYIHNLSLSLSPSDIPALGARWKQAASHLDDYFSIYEYVFRCIARSQSAPP